MCGIKCKVHGVAKDMPWTIYIYMAPYNSTSEGFWETLVAREEYIIKLCERWVHKELALNTKSETALRAVVGTILRAWR